MTFERGAVSVTITRSIYPVEVESKYLDSVGESEDGAVKAFDHGVKIYILKMSILADSTLKTSLKNFYESTIKGRTLPFTITPDTGVDLGAGAGTNITTARIWDISFRYKLAAFNFYEIDLTIRHLGS